MGWLNGIWAWLLTPIGLVAAVIAFWNWPWHT